MRLFAKTESGRLAHGTGPSVLIIARHHAADALGMLTHISEREIGAVGNAVYVPRRDLERRARVGEVGRALARVVGGQLHPRGGETRPARARGLDRELSGRGGVVGEAARRV
jgi:hypothetical protein